MAHSRHKRAAASPVPLQTGRRGQAAASPAPRQTGRRGKAAASLARRHLTAPNRPRSPGKSARAPQGTPRSAYKTWQLPSFFAGARLYDSAARPCFFYYSIACRACKADECPKNAWQRCVPHFLFQGQCPLAPAAQNRLFLFPRPRARCKGRPSFVPGRARASLGAPGSARKTKVSKFRFPRQNRAKPPVFSLCALYGFLIQYR